MNLVHTSEFRVNNSEEDATHTAIEKNDDSDVNHDETYTEVDPPEETILLKVDPPEETILLSISDDAVEINQGR